MKRYFLRKTKTISSSKQDVEKSEKYRYVYLYLSRPDIQCCIQIFQLTEIIAMRDSNLLPYMEMLTFVIITLDLLHSLFLLKNEVSHSELFVFFMMIIKPSRSFKHHTYQEHKSNPPEYTKHLGRSI